LISNNIKVESDNVDRLFETIADKLDHDLITDDTRDDKDDKVAFAKQTYKDSILSRKTPAKK
jgi:Mg2+/Co2+ transporter CorC